MSLISAVRIQQDTLGSFKEAISESLDLIKYSFQKKPEHVVIKPNMCYYWDFTTGQTTDPRFVAAIVEWLREKISHDIGISIVESDASAMKCKYAFKILGYEKMTRDYDVKLINLSESLCDSVAVNVGNASININVPREIQTADLRINLPKIKYTLEPIKISCALKNIFGCNPYPRKFKYHPRLAEAITAINKAMKFDLTILDGNVVFGNHPLRLGLVMASTDPVAIDSAASKIAGVNPRTIKYLQLAEKEGLGSRNYISKGVPLHYFQQRYPKKGVKEKLMSRGYRLVSQIGLGKRLGI